MLELRVLHDLVDLPDGAARYVGGRQPLLPALRVVGRQSGLDDLAQRRLVVGARGPVLEARIVERVRAAQLAHETDELLFGEDRQHQVAVTRAKPAGRRLPAHGAVPDLALLDA